MKKTLSFVLTILITMSAFVFCAAAQEKGIYPMHTVGDYTIVATTRKIGRAHV